MARQLFHNLLDSIGLVVVDSPTNVIFLVDKELRIIVDCYATSSNFPFSAFSGYSSLKYQLFNSIHTICYNNGYGKPIRTIENPYLGCKSLEEALIRKDLLETSQPA